MKSLLKGSVIYGLGQVLNKTISLVLLPFFTAYLTTKDYGITSVIGIYTLVVTSICTFGAGSVIGLIYYRLENQHHRQQTINTAVTFMAITSLVSLLLTALLLGPLNVLLFSGETYSQYIMLSTLTALLNVVMMPLTLWMQFEQKAIPFVIMNSSVVLIGVTLNIIAVMYFRMGVYGYIVTNLASAVINCLLFGAYYLFQCETYKMAKSHLKELLRLGWPLTFSFFFLFVIQNNSKYFLQLYAGLDSVGIFTIGFNLGTIISLIINSFNTAYYPYIMSFVNKPEDAPAHLSAVAEKYVLSFCILLTAVFFSAKPVVEIMVNENFMEAYKIIGPVALGWIFSGLFILIQPGLYYISRVHYISPVQLVAAALSVIFSILLIPRFGILAAAYSFAFGNFCMFLIMHLVNRHLNISHYYNRLSWKVWLNLLVSVAFIVAYQMANPEKNLILFSALSLLTYLATIALINLQELRALMVQLQEKFGPTHAS